MGNSYSKQKNDQENLGGLLKIYRNRTPKLTQEKMGIRIEVSSTTIRNWETGAINPSDINLISFIEVCLCESRFTPSKELEEAQTLWECWQATTGRWDDTFDIKRFSEVLHNRTRSGTRSSGPSLAELNPDSIFPFCQPLNDLQEFFGRVRERSSLLSRTKMGGSTSIVGPRRIGKTWLLSYLRLVAPDKLGQNYQVIYFDATSPDCNTVAQFTSRILEGLKVSLIGLANPDLVLLSSRVRERKERGERIVVCIDKFEGLSNRQEFNADFFSGLRAIAQNDGLVLITASKIHMKDILGEIWGISGLEGICLEQKLKVFSREDADEFIRTKSQLAQFDQQEQQRLLKYGEQLPICLQLAGLLLLQDKVLAAQGHLHEYRPKDETYWLNFEARLEEAYQAVRGG